MLLFGSPAHDVYFQMYKIVIGLLVLNLDQTNYLEHAFKRECIHLNFKFDMNNDNQKVQPFIF